MGWPIEAECGQNRMASRTQSPPQDGQVSISISCLDQEVKYSAVMPDIKAASEVVEPDIRLHPHNSPPGRAKLGPGALKRRFSNVRHRHIGIAGGNQMTGQLRGSTADIEDRGIQRKPRFLNQSKSDPRRPLIPAELLRLSLRVKPLPMLAHPPHPDCDAK